MSNQIQTKSTYQKPLPMESVYKQVQMLSNYCNEMAQTDKVKVRAAAYSKVHAKLKELADSRAMRTLLNYGD